MAVVQSEGSLVDARRPWIAAGPARSIEMYSGRVLEYAELYRRQPNVRLVVRFLARNIAQLNLKQYRRITDTNRDALDRAHPLAATIRQPNPRTTRHRFFDSLVHDLAIYDDFFALKVRNPNTGGLRLFRLPPQWTLPIGDSWIAADAYRFLGSRAQPEFPAETVIHIHGHNPDDPRVGLSPLESLRRILAEEAAAGEWREQYWRGAARISGVIQRPGNVAKWSETARNRFREDWRAAYSGNGAFAGTTPILEDGMEFKEAAFSAKDSEYLGARRLSREETAAAYHVSPLFVGILENANFSNVSEQHKHLYQDTLGPWLDMIEEELELQLLPEFADVEDVYFEFNLREKLKGSFEEEATALQTAVGAPWLLRNEARARQNLPPVDGGDVLVTPLNVLVGGQASPRDTAPALAAGRRPVKAIARASLKAVADLPVDVHGWHAKHVEILAAFFDRQGSAVTSRLGAGQSLDEAWDTNRWNDELTADLTATAATMTSEVAGQVAERFGGTYDEARAIDWIRENARVAAESINAATRDAVAGEVHTTGTSRRTAPAKDDDPFAAVLPDEPVAPDVGSDVSLDPIAAVWSVFELAAGPRTEQIATTRVTSIGNFARHEGASQSGVPFKVWRVNSRHSRHPHLNGETVPLGSRFSNGGRWPGDPALGADENAGCTCSLDFSTEAP